MNTITLNIIYPNTNYSILNKEIDKIIKNYLNIFYQNSKQSLSSLTIKSQDYLYKNYLSILINTEIDIGTAHPQHYINTIVYDVKNNNIITIDDFIKKQKYILYDLSKISRRFFLNNKELTNKEMLYKGTNPIKNNFQNFLILENGIKILFPRYQIAPYYQGEFELIIPYREFKK